MLVDGEEFECECGMFAHNCGHALKVCPHQFQNWIGLHYCFVPIGLAMMSESELCIIGDGLCWSKGDT
jgi:hypothetical protein